MILLFLPLPPLVKPILLRIVFINIHSSWAGQSVHADKSTILFSKNTATSSISTIRNILPYRLTPVTATHLGLPILVNRSKTATFSNIIDKINGNIEG